MARQSGDEFLILVAGLDVSADRDGVEIADVARNVAGNLREALAIPFDLAGTEVYCSGSVGISLYPVDAVDAESLLKHADAAMYRAEESGRDGAPVYTRDGGDAMARLSMSGRPAPRRCPAGFVLHYQPLLDLDRHGRRRQGAHQVDGRRPRHDHARRLHPARRAHRAYRADSRSG